MQRQTTAQIREQFEPFLLDFDPFAGIVKEDVKVQVSSKPKIQAISDVQLKLWEAQVSVVGHTHHRNIERRANIALSQTSDFHRVHSRRCVVDSLPPEERVEYEEAWELLMQNAEGEHSRLLGGGGF